MMFGNEFRPIDPTPPTAQQFQFLSNVNERLEFTLYNYETLIQTLTMDKTLTQTRPHLRRLRLHSSCSSFLNISERLGFFLMA